MSYQTSNLGLCTKSQKFHPRQWVVHSDPFYKQLLNRFVIPPTAVGGYFKCVLRKDLNNPPTTVGGITKPLFVIRFRKHLKRSTHSRGWNFQFFVQSQSLASLKLIPRENTPFKRLTATESAQQCLRRCCRSRAYRCVRRRSRFRRSSLRSRFGGFR